MEKRIATILIVIHETYCVSKLNAIISRYSNIIISRQGVPLHKRDISIISIVIDGTTDEIGALSGQIGKLAGVKVKTAIIKK